MGMELDTLDPGVILAPGLVLFGQAVKEKHIFIQVSIETDGAAHTHLHAFLELGHSLFELLILAAVTSLFRLEELLAANAIGRICKRKSQHLRACLELYGLQRNQRTLQDDVLGLALQLIDTHGLAYHAAAKEQAARPLHDQGRIFLGRLCGRSSRGLDRLCLGRYSMYFFFGCGLPLLPYLHSLQVIRRIEGTVNLHIAQRFFAGMANNPAITAQHLPHGPFQQLLHGMGPQNLTAKFPRHIQGQSAAIHRVFRALQQVKDYGIAL